MFSNLHFFGANSTILLGFWIRSIQANYPKLENLNLWEAFYRDFPSTKSPKGRPWAGMPMKGLSSADGGTVG